MLAKAYRFRYAFFLCTFSAAHRTANHMKTFLFLFISILFAFCTPDPSALNLPNTKNSSPVANHSFRIEIHQWSMSMDEILVFSNDSIFGKGFYLSGSHDSIFVNRKPTAEETQKILNTLATFELDSIKLDAPTKSVDDGIEFTFVINNGGISKTTDVYMQREENLLRLTSVLNSILPAGNQIGYNEHYIDNGY